MPTFTIFIRDDRYAVPTMAFVAENTRKQAAQLARQRLDESEHHLAIELCQEDAPIALINREGVVWLSPPELD